MRQTLLRTDAIFLGLAGLFGLVSDLLSWTKGAGPFGGLFHTNPTVIGVVEAHAQAILISFVLWYFVAKPQTVFGNWIAMLTHAVLGISNLIWFDVFRLVRAETNGAAVTIVHFVFVLLNAIVIVQFGRRLQYER
jgi:hypothetical protein